MAGAGPTERQHFFVCFSALVEGSGLKPDTIVSRLRRSGVAIGRSTIYDWMNGQHLPVDIDQFLSVVHECVGAAAERRADLDWIPRDDVAWKRILAAATGDGPGIATRGKVIGDWDPVRLGVHRAIGGGRLPTYVAREHDDLLRAALDPGVAANRLIVLRGGSSTGKSRTALEAVRARLPTWRVDCPPGDAALAERLSSPIRPQTVLWLDELREYAETRVGRKALARVADLLGGEGQIVVLAAVWPPLWRRYVERPDGGPGTADPYATVRRLLLPLPCLTYMRPEDVDPAVGGVLDVPEKFTRSELDNAAVLVREHGDAALGEAIEAAGMAGAQGEITQYLAGVPDLLDHYQGPGADPYGYAVITAAMDASRLGFPGAYPAELLTSAAESYLTSRQRTKVKWQIGALKYASRELRGAVCALEPIPLEKGDGTIGYRLADYLDQHGRVERGASILPSALWDALASHRNTAEDRIQLALRAESRGLYQLAAQVATGSAESGVPAAMELMARQWSRVGSVQESVAWYRKSSEIRPGNTMASVSFAEALAQIGAAEEASQLRHEAIARNKRAQKTVLEEIRRRANAEGNEATDAMVFLGRHSHEVGQDDEAEYWYRRAAGAGAAEGTWELAGLLEQNGRTDEATAILRSHAETGNPETMLRLIRLLHRLGAYDEAHPWVQRCLDAGGDPFAMALIVGAWAESQGTGGERMYRAAAEAGNPEGMWHLAEYLARTDRASEAIGWFQRSVEQGLVGVEKLARRLEELGCAEAAEAPLRALAARGNIVAMKQLAGLLEHTGHIDEAESINRTLLEIGAEATQAKPGNSVGMARLTDFLERTGRVTEADQVRKFGISPGGATVKPWTPLPSGET